MQLLGIEKSQAHILVDLIENCSTILTTGQAILVPATAANLIRADNPSKMLVTVIKSGYEGIIN